MTAAQGAVRRCVVAAQRARRQRRQLLAGLLAPVVAAQACLPLHQRPQVRPAS
jgi:hypothetical protein